MPAGTFTRLTHIRVLDRVECISKLLFLVRTVRIRVWNTGVPHPYGATVDLYHALWNSLHQTCKPRHSPNSPHTGAICRGSSRTRAGTQEQNEGIPRIQRNGQGHQESDQQTNSGKFYKSLASRLIGFSKITGLEILTHLITEYAELDDEAIQLIDKNMKTPINGETLFEDFIEQIEWNQEAVAVQNPYTPEQILSMAVSNVKKSGLYTEDCRDWDRKAANTKDWASFKVHFARAFKDVRKSHETSHTGGYAANVSEAHRNAEMFAEMQQDHSSALANLATATQSDREAVSLLSKTIAELTKQIATLTTKLDSANTTIMSLQGGGGNRTGRGNRDRGRNDSGGGNNNNGGGGGENKSDRNVWSRSGRKFNTNGYCHLHGFKVEEDHHSGNCTRRCEGHDATATRMNTKGGKQWNKDWINGGPTE